VLTSPFLLCPLLYRVFCINPKNRPSLSDLRKMVLSVKRWTMTEEELRKAYPAARDAWRSLFPIESGPSSQISLPKTASPDESTTEVSQGSTKIGEDEGEWEITSDEEERNLGKDSRWIKNSDEVQAKAEKDKTIRRLLPSFDKPNQNFGAEASGNPSKFSDTTANSPRIPKYLKSRPSPIIVKKNTALDVRSTDFNSSSSSIAFSSDASADALQSLENPLHSPRTPKQISFSSLGPPTSDNFSKRRELARQVSRPLLVTPPKFRNIKEEDSSSCNGGLSSSTSRSNSGIGNENDSDNESEGPVTPQNAKFPRVNIDQSSKMLVLTEEKIREYTADPVNVTI
jgi:hypothetical protein